MINCMRERLPVKMSSSFVVQVPRNRMIELTVKVEWCPIKLKINTLNAIELVSRSSAEGALSINQLIKSSCV